MKKRIIIVVLVVCTLLSLGACSSSSKNNSTFSIKFIDVGQGDAALIECDGRYMLIDGGPESHGEDVFSALVEKGIMHLDILALSHLDEDHIGGLLKAFDYISKVDLTISNSTDGTSKVYEKLEPILWNSSNMIKVPSVGEKFNLGSAEIEVIDNSANKKNDSLVLLITYQKTRFLFTGDIESKAQQRLTEKLRNDKRADDGIFKIDLIKMPHHGAYNDIYGFQDSNLNGLFNTIKSEKSRIYAVISVGAGNIYNHPHTQTLDLLEQAEVEVFRTDKNGDIIVKSDGKTLSIVASK